MPGNEPKSQHFVQRAYLEGFCDPVPNERTGSPFLWIHSATGPVRRQVPKECAVENYFYCYERDGQRSFLAEAHLSRLEEASKEVLDSAGHGTLPIALKDRFTLTGYVAMSLVRTPQGKKLIDRAAIDHATQIIRDLLNDPIRHAAFCEELEEETAEKCDPEEQKRILKAGQIRGVQSSRAWSLQMMLEMLLYFQEMFMGMSLSLLHANDSLFLTCDCPVRIHESSFDPLVLSRSQRIEMLFPLNRDFCLVGSYSKNKDRLELAKDEVQAVNTSIIRQADRCVYAPFDALYIRDELRRSQSEKVTGQMTDVIKF